MLEKLLLRIPLTALLLTAGLATSGARGEAADYDAEIERLATRPDMERAFGLIESRERC